MKPIFLVIAFWVAPFLAEAQQAKTVTPDLRLASLFDVDYLQRLQTLQPVQLERLNFYLDHSYEVQALPAGKEGARLPEAVVPDLKNFNVIAFERERNLYRNAVSPQLFRIKGTDMILCLLSEGEFVKRFNASRF